MNMTDLLQQLHYDSITLVSGFEWRIPLLPSNGVRHSSLENVETIYDLITRGKLKVAPLISHRLPPARIKEAYDGLLNKKDEYFGVVLDWTSSTRDA
jgi:threonine dehydrogenase-like Zn-dependent dehydrogenase